MNLTHVEQVVNAVLYEGYMLYPYRASSVKNRQRWTFGGVYPQAYSQDQSGSDTWNVQTECLVVGVPDQTMLDIRVRFLHLMAREVGVFDTPFAELPDNADSSDGPTYRVVDVLRLGDRLYQTWQEAVEREVSIPDLSLTELVAGARRVDFAFPSQRSLEALRDPDADASRAVVGVIARTQQPLSGIVELSGSLLEMQNGEQLCKITVRVLNTTSMPERDTENAAHEQGTPSLTAPYSTSRDVALLRSFVSTHVILGAEANDRAAGEFVSLLDPPDEYREAAAGCSNIGLWPVLVGPEGAHDVVLASPIILYDYPQIAPESPGDLFDGTEIDEILTLRILSLTDDEQREMCAVDERARALLQRTAALTGDDLMRLHGTVRSLRPWEER